MSVHGEEWQYYSIYYYLFGSIGRTFEYFTYNIICNTKHFVDLIIVCDDGSIDNTSNIVSDIRDVILINHNIRQGKGSALRSLFKEAIKCDPDIIVLHSTNSER